MALQAALSVSCLYAFLIAVLHGRSRSKVPRKQEGILLFAFFSLGGLNNVFCNWLVILQSSCGLISGGEFWRFFGVTKLLAQADYAFQIKSLHVFQLPVFPYVALITEYCHVNL